VNYIAPLAIVLATLFASAAASFSPTDPQRVSAVFPPWWSAAESLAAASRAGAVSRVGSLPFILAVSSRDPGLAHRLKAEGALFLFDGSEFSFCAL
jgi:hypothetical protein